MGFNWSKPAAHEDLRGFFENRVQRGESCWIWRGRSSIRGYGVIRVGNKHLLAHRVAYELFKGPIPDGMCACHRCDRRECVNPDHIFLGTNADNVADRTAKGRSSRHRVKRKLTTELAQMIRVDPRPSGEVARIFGVSRSTVQQIRSGRIWRPKQGIAA